MVISPMKDSSGAVLYYFTKPLYTQVNGRLVFVSNGYHAETQAEVIRLAYLNASIRNMIATFVQAKFKAS